MSLGRMMVLGYFEEGQKVSLVDGVTPPPLWTSDSRTGMTGMMEVPIFIREEEETISIIITGRDAKCRTNR